MNQNQITVTRGDDRAFALIIDDEYADDDALFVVDGLFEKELVIDDDPGSGYATATVEVASADTEDAPDHRKAYRYELSVSHDGDNVTVRRGLFVVVPGLPEVA